MNFDNNKGFAIVYLMLFVMLVAAVASMIYLKETDDAQRYAINKEYTYIHNIKKSALEFYKANAYQIDSNSGNYLVDKDGNTITTYEQLASVMGTPLRDAWNKPFILYISGRQTETSTGFYYHNFYIVSAGPDHKFESTYDSSSDNMKKAGDDFVVTISGKEVEGNYYLMSSSKLYNMVKLIRNFTETLYQYADLKKMENFFVMETGSSPNGGGDFECYKEPTKISETNIPGVIGITSDVYNDAYGHSFLFANCSSDLSTYSPPYTAKVGMQMPGGKIIWVIFSYPL